MRWLKYIIFRVFPKKVIWSNKSSKEMTQEDIIEYAEYKKWLVSVSHKIPTNGQSILLKFKDRYFRIKELG